MSGLICAGNFHPARSGSDKFADVTKGAMADLKPLHTTSNSRA
jgi:hypothetical protein